MGVYMQTHSQILLSIYLSSCFLYFVVCFVRSKSN